MATYNTVQDLINLYKSANPPKGKIMVDNDWISLYHEADRVEDCFEIFGMDKETFFEQLMEVTGLPWEWV